jgi:hypothetical protein
MRIHYAIQTLLRTLDEMNDSSSRLEKNNETVAKYFMNSNKNKFHFL